MTNVTNLQVARRIALAFALCIPLACDSARAPSGPQPPTVPAFARAQSGVTVAAANPSFGDQGQTNEAVTITGTGFDSTSQAAWLRNGVVDTTITVTSTKFVNATTLIATINISPKSPVDYRDIQVVSYASGGRTQGIGSLLFEVTQAVQVPGTSWVRSINDNGEATGTLSGGVGVFYYNPATAQLDTVFPNGTGYDISAAGTAIVGAGTFGSGNGFPFLFTRVGGTWQATALPVGTETNGGVARSMLTDGTGQVVQIGGIENFLVSKSNYSTRAVTWIWQPGTATWQRIVLPPGSGTEVRHRAISANGIFGGTGPGARTLAPAVWVPNGTGGYTYTLLSTSNGAVNGVRLDGGMIVGFISTAVYWLAQPGGTWSAPISVPACGGVKDVADSGRFLMNECTVGKSNTSGPAFADPPYASLTRLGGLGPKNIPGTASGISHGGRYAGGYATVNGLNVGIYWQLP
jgi:hypothetical protein